ncbi:MAG: ABC transporter ATP-binding protein [Desulfobacterales bacterium]|jgi:branched-chain amino acid transport system ATP-binding protein
MMLEVEGIHTYYGLSHILFDVSLKVKKRQVVCLLGRNGAGKTTTFRTIMGLNPPSRGQIRFNDVDVTGTPSYQLVRKGMGWVPDDRRIFVDLSVGENLEIAEREASGEDKWDKQKVYELFPALKDLDSRKGGLLSGGEQKMLAIGRALMTNPQFLLLDEPTEGLAPVLVKSLGERIKKLKELGLTVLLAEQNVKFTLELSDYGYIIDNGRICYQGTVDELVDNQEVKRICGI